MVTIRKNCLEILEGRGLRNYVRLGKWARISMQEVFGWGNQSLFSDVKIKNKNQKQIRWKVSTSLELPRKLWWLRWLQLTLYEKEFWKSQPLSHPFGWSLSRSRSISHQFWQLLYCKLRKDLWENSLPPELSCIYVIPALKKVLLNSQKWSTCNFSLKYPFINYPTGYENIQTYQVKVVNLIQHQILVTNLQGNTSQLDVVML